MKTLNTQAIRTLALASAAAAALFSGTASHAATATDNLAVSATVSANCTIATGALAFGAYDPISANASADLDATGTVTVTCTDGAAVAISLGQGANADTGSTDAAPLRRLTDGTDHLTYSLFSDSGRTTVWGNDATVDVETAGTGVAEEHTVYGRITAGQTDASAGSYSDTVVATVTF
ncbi:MAG TPA: spore coat U domain-containing protein [Porticoccaceae bacterium]|nr:spore coat U domain-containing protein [Porticoccaceae bacterium]